MNSLLSQAIAYVAAGWPVFPCDRETKRPLVGALPGEPRGSGGLKRATRARDVVETWWKKWPEAMIGVPTGPAIGFFVLDFDAGVDKDTGEIFDADQLIRNLEAELGEELPETWTVETPRGGRHLYFPFVEGIGNRADLLGRKSRIDVRGDGGYVIVPPSTRDDGKAYRWLVAGPFGTDLPPGAPAALLDLVLRRGRWKRGPEAGEDIQQSGAPIQHSESRARPLASNVDAAIRKYALAAFDQELLRVATAPDGARNATLNEASFALGQLVGAGALEESMVRGALQSAARAWPNYRHSAGTIESGLRAGIAQPRNLADIKAKASRRSPAGAGGQLRAIEGGRGRPAELDEDADRDVAAKPHQLELRDILRQKRKRGDPPASEPRGGAGAGKWRPDFLGLPREDPCPVIPLGFEGELVYLLNSSGQLVGWTEQRFTHAGIQKLFSATPNWPEWAYPRPGRARKITDPETGEERTIIPIESFKDDEVRKGLFRALDRKGMFSPDQKVRGRGAWRMADGRLYYHAGEEIWFAEGQTLRARETGLIDDAGGELVFPRMAALPPPWPKRVEPAENPARQLIEGLRRWNWDRPEIDPILFLGWIGVAMLGGALKWRAAVVLVGDKGTGKSELQKLLKELFGDALLDSANTTAAGIYQALAHDARPVAVDEIEAGEDNRKVMAVVELMRQASSGAFGRRGAADARAQGVEFQIRSAFLFSAINNPPLLPQDLSRIALLRLRELAKDGKGPPVIVDAETCGRKILGRLMLEWHRFDQTLAAYKAVLEGAGGHSGRGGDTYGTLLACADLILGPELATELSIPMVDDLAKWGELLHVDTLPEVGDALPNWRACINHLMQARVPAWRNGRRSTIGQLIDDMDERYGGQSVGDDVVTVGQAKRDLAQAGIGFAYEQARGPILAIPNQSGLVEELFFGSRWQGAAGAGGWSEALRQGPRDVCLFEAKGNRVRINGVQQRCTLIVLGRLDDRRPQEPSTAGGRSGSDQPAAAAGRASGAEKDQPIAATGRDAASSSSVPVSTPGSPAPAPDPGSIEPRGG